MEDIGGGRGKQRQESGGRSKTLRWQSLGSPQHRWVSADLLALLSSRLSSEVDKFADGKGSREGFSRKIEESGGTEGVGRIKGSDLS